MTWAAWRLQRTETIVTAAIVAAVAAVLVPVGLHMASVYRHDHLSTCVSAQQKFSSCGKFALGGFLQQFQGINSLLGWFNLLPGLVGVLLAAPLLLDLENGTFRFAWTQSVTRRRWIAGKVGIAAAVAFAAAVVFSQLITWYRGPLDHLQGRLDSSSFDFEGTVDYAYVLFALGLALTIGVLARRVVPALIVGFVSYFVARVFVDTWLRQRFLTPVSATWKASVPGPNLNRDWVLTMGPSDRLGHFTAPIFRATTAVPCAKGQGCIFTKPPGEYTHAVFLPASRFWALQGVETAMFGGIAAALILFAAWWIHDRVA
jgi:hypothetical protein